MKFPSDFLPFIHKTKAVPRLLWQSVLTVGLLSGAFNAFADDCHAIYSVADGKGQAVIPCVVLDASSDNTVYQFELAQHSESLEFKLVNRTPTNHQGTSATATFNEATGVLTIPVVEANDGQTYLDVQLQVTLQSATETILAVSSQNLRKKDKSDKNNQKVEVCHKPGTPAQKTLTIPMNAYENGHKGHGDTLGACPSPPPPTQVDNNEQVTQIDPIIEPPVIEEPPVENPPSPAIEPPIEEIENSQPTENPPSPVIESQVVENSPLESPPSPAEPDVNIKDMAYLPYAKKTYVLYDSGTVEVYVDGFANPPVETIPLPDVSNPQGMALGFGEDLYIADTGNHRILKLKADNGYTPDTQISPTGTFGSQGTGMAQFQSPEDVALGKINGRVVIFVADTGNNRIQRFSATGGFEMAFDGANSTAGVLNAPRSLTVSSGGGVAVVDGGNGRVVVFDTFGHFHRNFGSLNNPTKITQNFMTGDYIVADTGNSQVQIFRSNGDAQQEITGLNIPPVAAVFNDGQLAEELFIAPSTGDISSMKVVDLSPDAPDATPVEIVKKFVAAIAAEDLQTAKTFLADNRQQALDFYEQNPDRLAKIAQKAQSIQAYALVQRKQNLGFVIGLTSAEEPVEFALRRDVESRVWEVSAF